jgi:hypothetical protein
MQNVACPQCGADNEMPAGERLLACAFCDATLFLDRAGAVSHYRVPFLLDEQQALAALRRWMAGNDTVKDLDRKSVIESARRVSFPMWMFRTEAAGRREVYIEPAAPTPIPQLADLELPAGRLESYRVSPEVDESLATTVPLATARGWLEQRGVGEVTETSLVHLPLWRCRYRYGDASFEALVDGSTGAVLATVYPEKAEAPFVLVALLALAVFGIEGLLIGDPFLRLLAFLVSALPLALIAFWVSKRT